MKFRKYFIYLGIISFTVMFAYSCQTLKQIANTIENLSKIKFKLDNVSSFRLAGITIADKKSVSDFSLTDGLKLANAFKNNSFPADFILNVAALNPNDGTAGTKQTLATLVGFDWKMYIDDVETISGGLNNEVTIPGSGQSTIFPLTMSLDLFKFFKNKSYEGIANIALSLGGVSGSPAKLKLDAKPTINTQFGPISYPGRITIIDKEFR